jgi:hypothetical protein
VANVIFSTLDDYRTCQLFFESADCGSSSNPNDHPPAHVHVLGPGWMVVVDLVGLEVRATNGCDEREALRVLRLIAKHRGELLDAWRRFHG